MGSKIDFSRQFGLSRLGIHHVVLSPGERTSLPHAESLEEEFVFVISGTPHVWIDGYVYLLPPHYAVGFPAGTGIAHNFINNTETNVELLVLGERTKKENRCSFPIDPEQKELSSIWWENFPARPLGPHNGKPGPVQAQDTTPEWPAMIVDCRKLEKSKGWHYPGDSETGCEYARLTDPLELKALGIGYETLAPGKRTAFPHCHKVEEEFVFILSGTATIWMNGQIHETKPGEGVVFVPGTNIAHSVINNTNEPLHYIVVGEAKTVDERIFYPMHPFRNEQCRKRGNLWEDRPQIEMGPHDGRPAMGLKDHLALQYSSDEQLILQLFKNSPAYFKNVDGCEPSLTTVKQALTDQPKKLSESYLKEFLLIEYNDEPVGVADLHIHHPQNGIAYLGLLLLSESEFGKGLGRRSYELIEDYAKRIFDIKSIRLGVSDDNDVSGYWKRMGFLPNGRTYSWQGENKTTNVQEFEKHL